MTDREQRRLIAILGLLSFASVYASVVVVPVLAEIAAEYGTTAGAAGLAVAAFGAPGILIPLVSGPYSDRFGRRIFLIGGTLVIAVGTFAAAFAPTFELLLAARIVAGIGASVVFPTVFAAVGDAFAPDRRGRALSALIGINTMSTIVGVPIAGIVAEATSWRASVVLVAVLGLIACAVAVRSFRPATDAASGTSARLAYVRILRDRSATSALLASLLGSIFWFSWATYYVVFFRQTYGLPLGAASTLGLTLGAGVLIGSQIGGRFGDRSGHRAVASGAIVAAGVLIVLLTVATPPLAAAAALNVLISALIGARFAANQALLSEQVPEARGSVFAVSASFASIAMVVAAAAGGALVDAAGFAAIGIFCLAVSGIVSAMTIALITDRTVAARMRGDRRAAAGSPTGAD